MLLIDLDEALDKGVDISEANIFLEYAQGILGRAREDETSMTIQLSGYVAKCVREGSEFWRVEELKKSRENTIKVQY